MGNYTSSIINKYGDSERIKEDSKTLMDILQRQGFSLFIDVMAENVGNTVNKHNLDQDNVNNVIKSLTEELTEAIRERT